MQSNAPSRPQLLHWFQAFTSVPPVLTLDSLRKVTYLLHTYPDIPQENPDNLSVFLSVLGKKFGEWVKIPSILPDLHNILTRLLVLKKDKTCKRLLKREYIDQMEQIVHHRISNEHKRREYESQKQKNSSYFVTNCLSRYREDKKRLAQLEFDSPNMEINKESVNEDEEIRKKVQLAMLESPFQARDFIDSIEFDLPEVNQPCHYRVEPVLEMLPTMEVPISQRLERVIPLADPRIVRRITGNGLREVLEVEEIRRELPRLSVVLDLEMTFLEVFTQGNIQTLSVLIPPNALVLKGHHGEDLFLIPRPGFHRFIQQISRFVTLTVHTSSLSGYTSELMKALDPEDRYFKGGIQTTPGDCMDTDIDRLIVISARPGLWDDGHLLQSLPFSVSKTGRETDDFRVSAITGVIYGPGEPLKWASEKEDGELNDLADALEAIYTKFLLSGAVHTFAYEISAYRRELMSDMTLSFALYAQSIGETDYTVQRLSLYRFAAKHMGVREDEGGWEIAEYGNKDTKRLPGTWLLDSFFRLKKLEIA